MNKVHAIITVARQVDGEYVFIKTEKAFAKLDKAEAYLKNLTKQFADKVSTPAGEISVVCERALFEIEIEE